MNKERQMFTDPQTKQELESTCLARWCAGAIWGLLCGLLGGWVAGMVLEIFFQLFLAMPLALVSGLLGGLGCGLFLGLASVLQITTLEDVRNTHFMREIHDRIARSQHRHRQRFLRSKEDIQVPDGALSRAQSSGEPTPTDAALSLADSTEENDRLAASTDSPTEAEVPVNR